MTKESKLQIKNCDAGVTVMDVPLEKVSELSVRRRIKVHGYINQDRRLRSLQHNLLFPGHLFQGTLFPVTPD
jgi:hypothetical protein